MKIENQVFALLMTADFEDWYKNEFTPFVDGDDEAPTKEKIMYWLSKELEWTAAVDRMNITESVD